MDWYPWIKALHIVSVIAFMAGMLYLPRLFVYHSQAPSGSPQSDTFSVMERRLLQVILNPALVLVWLTGLMLAYSGYFFKDGWLHAKLLLVLVLSGLHGYFASCVRRFDKGTNARSSRFYRIINEVPTLLMILIVILVVVKPF
jgi:putative membrane protein